MAVNNLNYSLGKAARECVEGHAWNWQKPMPIPPPAPSKRSVAMKRWWAEKKAREQGAN